MSKWTLRLWVLGALVLATPALAVSQVTTGQISGTVRDSSGAVLPNAELFILNRGTGTSRTVQTDAQGRFEAPNLALGEYEVIASAAGFQSETRRGVAVTVGGHVVLNPTLSPSGVSEEVTVSGGAPLVETTSSAVGALVSREQIRDLPLNGRDYTQLALLQPGVVAYREQSRELNRGMGTRFSISGARHNQIGFRLNGIDIGDGAGTTPGSATGHNLGVDAIQEFQVLTNTFTAEQGKSAGGVVNIVHKSGTNALHGSAFEYHRNSALDNRNYFDPVDLEKPPFRRNQFGLSAGGPILRNKTFFFGAFEGLRERLDQTSINIVLTDGFKNGEFGAVDPRMKPYFDAMPGANGAQFSNGTGELISRIETESYENYLVGKIDHTFSGSDSASVSYTFDAGSVDAPQPRDGIVTSTSRSENKFHYVTAQHTHIFSSNVLHTLRGGFNRSNVQALQSPLVDMPASLAFVPGVNSGTIEVDGIDRFGLFFGPQIDRELLLDSLQIANSLTWIRGAHSFKAGMEVYRFQVTNTSFSRTGGGRYNFRSLADLRLARPNRFQADDPESPSRPTITQGLFGFFIQDDVRLAPTVTLNAGLRYEFITTPRSTEPNQSTLVNLTDPELTTGHTFMRNPSLKNFAPRVGLAWDVFGNQRTALRGGLGVYHDQITSYYYLPMVEANPPFNLTRTVNNPPFPSAYQEIASGRLPSTFSLQTLQHDLDQPYRVQYNVGVQQELSRNMAVAAYYVGARSYNSTQFFLNANSRAPSGTTADGRLFFNENDDPINPNFGAVQRRTTGGDSWYNSLQLLIQRRASGGLSYQGSYTLQKNEDTGSIAVFSSEGLNTVAQQSIFAAGDEEKGLSSYDVRHTLTTNVNYDVPSRSTWTGLARVLGEGWQLSGIATFSSGHPFTPILGFDNANVITRSRGDHLRPDLAAGADSNPVNPGNVDRYFDATAFVLPPRGTLGNLPRNTMIGPGMGTVDVSVKKRFRFGGARLLEFRSEVFNVLNRANFRIPENSQRTVFRAGGVLNPTAGRLTATSSSSRQVQFSLRFEF